VVAARPRLPRRGLRHPDRGDGDGGVGREPPWPPAASRGGAAGQSTWQGWTAGDHHTIGLLDDVEREVASNLFRSHVPEIIALTGYPGIGPTPEPLGSRRLAESGQHLAAR
jgi:hypothetical protein